MKISIVGTGYVGLVSGVCLAEKGHEVICVDHDHAKVDLISSGKSPIFERNIDSYLQRNLGLGFSMTTKLARAVQETELTLIAVGTPSDGHRIDLTAIKQAAREMRRRLEGEVWISRSHSQEYRRAWYNRRRCPADTGSSVRKES